MEPIKIIVFIAPSGKEPFTEWLYKLDVTNRAVIRSRLVRIRLGNFGDCKQIKNEYGIWEFRIDFGPGYRIYFGKVGPTIVVILLAGNKGSQNRDITQAKKYWILYRKALNDKN